MELHLGHGWLMIISNTLLVVKFYRNSKFNKSKGEWIDIFISLYLYVCFLVR